MGIVKQEMIEAEERGWSSVEGYVCDRCFHDEFLRAMATEFAERMECDFCGRKSRKEPIAAPADVLVERIAGCLYEDYTDPIHELAYESAEGGYQGNMTDVPDVIEGDWGDAFANDDFREAVVSAICDHTIQLCKRNYALLSDDQVLRYGWEDFCRITKHERRYFFAELAPRDPRNHQEMTPGAFLETLSKFIKQVRLVKPLETGTAIFRARIHKSSEVHNTAGALGTVPVEQCIYSNRMSPAGVPMFYGALDRRTAILEVLDPDRSSKGKRVTSGAFTASAATVLDLRLIPEPPSIFDLDQRDLRTTICFLEEFVGEVSKPIKKDGREHIEYVPTQIFTEFLRQQSDVRIDGIIFPSSRNEKGACVVLFSENDFCTDSGTSPPTWKTGLHLKLDPATLKTSRLPKLHATASE